MTTKPPTRSARFSSLGLARHRKRAKRNEGLLRLFLRLHRVLQHFEHALLDRRGRDEIIVGVFEKDAARKPDLVIGAGPAPLW